jgi:hypothetical protein
MLEQRSQTERDIATEPGEESPEQEAPRRIFDAGAKVGRLLKPRRLRAAVTSQGLCVRRMDTPVIVGSRSLVANQPNPTTI